MYSARWRRRIISVLWTAWLRWNGLGGRKRKHWRVTLLITKQLEVVMTSWCGRGVAQDGIPSIRKAFLRSTEHQRATSWGLSQLLGIGELLLLLCYVTLKKTICASFEDSISCICAVLTEWKWTNELTPNQEKVSWISIWYQHVTNDTHFYFLLCGVERKVILVKQRM